MDDGAEPSAEEERVIRAETEQLLSVWLSLAENVGPEQYRPADRVEAVPPRALADSRQWSGQFFRPEASPHAPGRSARWAFHVATSGSLDLLRCAYDFEDLGLEIVESRCFTLVRVTRPGASWMELPPADRADRIEAIDRRILSGPYAFRLGGPLGEGCFFTSNPAVPPYGAWSWEDRRDGGIRDGLLWFLWYKRNPQIVGFLNGRQWFEDRFRSGPVSS